MGKYASVIITCSILLFIASLLGCTQSDRKQFIDTVTLNDRSAMTSLNTLLSSRNGDVAAAISALESVRVLVKETRPAQPSEKAQAKQKATEELKDVSPQDRKTMKEQRTYVAVKVDPAADAPPAPDTKSVVLVDPETGDAVNDTVYEVDSDSSEAGDKIDLGEYEALYVD